MSEQNGQTVFSSLEDLILTGVERGKRTLYRVAFTPFKDGVKSQTEERYVLASSNAAAVVAAIEDIGTLSVSVVSSRELYDAVATAMKAKAE